MGRTYCDVDECLEEAKSKGKCWAHAKQAQRGTNLRPVRPRLTRRGDVLEAIIAVADADAEQEHAFRSAWARFTYHARRYLFPDCEKCAQRQGCPRPEGG